MPAIATMISLAFMNKWVSSLLLVPSKVGFIKNFSCCALYDGWVTAFFFSNKNMRLIVKI